MRGPQIISAQTPAPFDRLMAARGPRYLISITIAMALALAAMIIQRYLYPSSYILLLYIAILLASVFGGLGPGLLATFLICGANSLFRPAALNASQFQLLVTEGILINFVGGILRSAQLAARERLAANLHLEQQILEIGDDERGRIGHDLHDGLGQHLTGISLLSETMAQQLQSGQKIDPTNIETITRMVSESVRITRDLAKSLSPVTLETDGLLAAIEELADTASGMFNIVCECEVDGQEAPLNRTRSLHVFRIVQEAVNNSVRHGKAKRIDIKLRAENKVLTATVTDNGSGLSQKTTSNPGLGLRIMQYRARMLGASLTIERANAAGGTVVTCICPIDEATQGS